MTQRRAGRLLRQLWHGADYNYEQWLDSPDILADDFRLMGQARCNIMNVGIFAWSMLEPEEGRTTFEWLDRLMDDLAAHGIAADLATPSAAPPAWLSRKYPETLRVNKDRQRVPHRGRQNFCVSSPIYREKVAAINTRLAERYRDHPALALWHVSNEYLGDPCYCDLCQAGFRDWLKARYKDLDSLNQAWWTTFWSHRYTGWDQIEPFDPSCQGLMLDWQRFTSDRVLDFFLAECAPLRAITPDVPLTTNFMQPNVGLNYWRFAEQVDIIAWDSYPCWHQTDDTLTGMQTGFYHDLHRSFKGGQPFLLLESTPSVTNWQPVSRLKRPGMHRLSSFQAVAHGANSVQYFQWRQSRGSAEKFHGAVVSHLNTAETRTFREVANVGETLAKLQGVAETRIAAPVAVIYDLENEWALNLAELPTRDRKLYRETCQRHYSPFWKRGIPVDILPAEAALDAYAIVVAPMLYMLIPGFAERVEQYVLAGGTFVTTYLSGLVNESDLCFLGGYPPALRRTLGIYAEERDTLTEQQSGTITASVGNALGIAGTYQFHDYAEIVHAEQAGVLATYSAEFYAGTPALTLNAYGKGRACFIAARTEDRFLDDVYGALARQAGLAGVLPVQPPEGVSVQVRQSDARRFAFVMNFAAAARQVEVGAGWTDAVSGQPVAASLSLEPYGLAILAQDVRAGDR